MYVYINPNESIQPSNYGQLTLERCLLSAEGETFYFNFGILVLGIRYFFSKAKTYKSVSGKENELKIISLQEASEIKLFYLEEIQEEVKEA